MTYSADSEVSAVENHARKETLKFDPWLAAVLVCFIMLAWLSWGKLTHPFFDTGNEAEVTARLLAGEVLYRDLETNYGPFAYYVNAIALRLFGQRLEVFYTIGLVLALAATLLFYRLAKQLTNAPWAALCTAYLLIYCAFNPGGLLNFIAPYSYGAVYATVLCLVAITAVDRYARRGQVGWLIAAAIAIGFAGLAKQEFGVAGLAAVLVGANFCSPKNLQARIVRSSIIILVASACVLLPLILLAQQVTWEKIYTSLIPSSKSHILTASGLFNVSLAQTLEVWNNTFKVFLATSLVVGAAMVTTRWLLGLGILDFSRNSDRHLRVTIKPNAIEYGVEVLTSIVFALSGLFLLQVAAWYSLFKLAVVILLVVGGATLAVRWLLKTKSIPESIWLRTIFKVITSVTFIALSLLLLRRLACCSNAVLYPLNRMAWLLPLLVGWFALNRKQLIQHRYAALLWTLLVFSVLLNARFLFQINPSFYAIFAVTPVLLFFTLLYQLAAQTNLPIAQFLLICLLIGGGMNIAELGQYRYAIQSNRGALYTKDANLALAFNQTIRYINSSGTTSVLVMPAGAMLNFLTATHSPSRETIFLPGVLPTAEAEREFLARMEQNSPKLIVYVDIPFWWLKKGYQTYAEFNPLVHEWITRQHQLVYVSPQLVFGDKEWNIRIYDRN